MIELNSVYAPKEYEKRIWDHWIAGGHFRAHPEKGQKPYVVLMPPPNVTDRLHMGHGLNNTIQDILVRWKRMSGFDAVWLPGTDHAGIATQMMLEKHIMKTENKTRQQVGREEFLKRLWKWKEDNGGIIIEQLKRLGASADWEREAFTMSPPLSKAVREIFVRLFEQGLIYRGKRLVNWDTVLLTAVSDDEVVNVEMSGNLWYFKYPLADDPSQFVMIATTRPETMLGDTAVAVHPEDERYKAMIGKKLRLPFVDRLIPIIGDDAVKPEFGTGAVKVTPAHDPNDFAMGKRHQLEFIDVMNPNGSMADNVPERFRGLDRFKARTEIVRGMKELGLFEKEVAHKNVVPHSDRSKTIVEPRVSEQWYVKMGAIVEDAIGAARRDELKFYPENWKKVYLHWLENIQDWCISRQLWWGHRIPIWYCAKCPGLTTGREDPTKCAHCGSTEIRQEEDVLDTWFSSWLWPVSTLGWPTQSKDLERYFPSDVLVTGPDIIFLWVARMIMLGYITHGKLAFKDVYFNSIVCDMQGRKFSKTLGNGIDPLPVMDRCGADAVRFTCVSLASIGGRVRMQESDFDNGGRFLNKIWNAARFLFRYCDEGMTVQPLDFDKIDLSGKWLLWEFAQTADTVNKCFEQYRINEAVETLYHFVWGSFCDWGIECAKESLTGEDKAAKERSLSLLLYVLEGALRLASPVIPFIAEELWQRMPRHPQWDKAEALVVASYPDARFLEKFASLKGEAEEWQSVMGLVNGVRSIRSQATVPPAEKLDLYVRAEGALGASFQKTAPWIKRLAGIKEFSCGADLKRPGKCLVHVGQGFEAYVPVGSYLDVDKETQRLRNEINRLSGIVKGTKGRLSNKEFVDKAPKEVVDQARQQLETMTAQVEGLTKNLQALEG